MQGMAAKVARLRRAKGWSFDELARRSGVARNTLANLEEGRTARPHSATLAKLAAALGIEPGELWGDESSGGLGPRLRAVAQRPRRADGPDKAAEFDRRTNPVVDEVLAERPRLFADWRDEDWDDLYSRFATGGPLSRDGVLHAAHCINAKRETLYQVHVLLDTHLAEVAAGIIDRLYAMVQLEPEDAAHEGSSGG